jgi:hypothetical protein
LKDSVVALSVGLPRRLKSRMTWFVYAQQSIAALTHAPRIGADGHSLRVVAEEQDDEEDLLFEFAEIDRVRY